MSCLHRGKAATYKKRTILKTPECHPLLVANVSESHGLMMWHFTQIDDVAPHMDQ